MNTSLLEDLNEPQQSAVAAKEKNILVLAGAGSGKTRVIAHRIAYLVQEKQVSPLSVLAVTFTNKAAAEMRSRVEALLHMSVNTMWLGTFHGLAHRLLRQHWMEAGLPENFQIIDSEDQKRIIKQIIKSMNLDEKRWAPKLVQWYINGKKEQGLRPEKIQAPKDFNDQTLLKVYQAYEKNCIQNGLVDFAELLLRAYELFVKNPPLLQHYQQRLTHILVDEFQDTNTLQYDWLKTLVGEKGSLMAVGDDDQSIYGWRGAKIENIQRFSVDFKETRTIRLEQNYRSTSVILDAANHVISNNSGRLGKHLWTDESEGDLLQVYSAFNDYDEANFIVARIKEWIAQGHAKSDVAILYRSNAQSRLLEEALIQAAIPYRVYGGLRFFDRAEIRDALAYLRLAANPHDNAAFERIINLPTRGLGDRTLEMLRESSHREQISLWQAAEGIIEKQTLPARAHNALQHFILLMTELSSQASRMELGELTEFALNHSGLLMHYRQDKSDKAESRVENLQEFIRAASEFISDDPSVSSLHNFLTHAILESSDPQADAHQDSIQLMTLHAAKGLEFPLVFMTGMEEGLFPHGMSSDSPSEIEEERRLCYVGITRAMKKLYLTHAEVRRLHGQEIHSRASRFIHEIPETLKNEIRRKASVTPSSSFARKNRSTYGSIPISYRDNNPQATPTAMFTTPVSSTISINGTSFSLGQRVAHAKFGEGTITNFEGQGEHARVEVQFKKLGVKWLILSYAKLAAL